MQRIFTPMITSAALAMGFVGSAAAADTWNFNVPCDPTPACVAGGVSATVSGYSSINSSTAYVLGTVTDQDPSGLGLTGQGGENGTAPDHAFDNRAGGGVFGTATNEVLLISFGTSKVALTSMALGWSNTDSDVSVLRWDGAGAPTAAGTSLTSAGWTLVSSKDVDGSAAATGSTGGGSFALSAGVGANAADTKVSSWWMISTYFGATVASSAGAALGGLDNTANDFFKILSFTGNICINGVAGGSAGTQGTAVAGNGGACRSAPNGVPEPGSLALLGVAALGAVGARRRWFKRG